MDDHIFGIAYFFNFKVNDQFIIWENHTIAVSSISIFSKGISTKYTRKTKEKKGFSKAMHILGVVLGTAIQMVDEDNSDKVEILDTALNVYGSETNLPCMNLILSNGVKMEITFTDMIFFHESMKAVKQAFYNRAKQGTLEMSSTDIIVEGADFYGEAHFIEGGKVETNR